VRPDHRALAPSAPDSVRVTLSWMTVRARPGWPTSRRRGPGLIARLLALFALVFTLAMGAVLVVVAHTVSASLSRGVTSTLVDETQEFAQAARSRPLAVPVDRFAVAYLRTRAYPGGTVAMVAISATDAFGTVGSASLRAVVPIRTWLASPPRHSQQVTVHVGTTAFQVLATPLVEHGQRLGTFVVAANLSSVQKQATTMLLATLAQAVAALAIAMLAAYLVLRRVLRVVGRVSTTADAIGREDLSQRLDPVGGHDELSHLVATFNAMLGRLDASFLGQRQLLADVSHQLRTPLTVIRGHLEVLRRTGFADQAEAAETIDLVLDELSHTASLVGDLMLLGRALEPDFLDLSPIPIRALLDDAFVAARALAPRQWQLDLRTDAVVRVDRTKLRGAILNLLENAVAATRPEEPITLAASLAGAPGHEIVIAVSDGGHGIAAAEQASVFERFRRGRDGSGRGAGLGLSIVRAVSEAHGGTVALASTLGMGTTVSITLPATCRVVEGADASQEAVHAHSDR